MTTQSGFRTEAGRTGLQGLRNLIHPLRKAGAIALMLAPALARGEPAAPSKVVAEALSSTQIRLSWQDNATNETDYEVDRATSADFSQNFLRTRLAGPNRTQYVAASLTEGQRFFFRVRAVLTRTPQAALYSGVSATVNARPVRIAPIDFRARVVPGADPGKNVELRWYYPASPAGIQRWELEESLSADFDSATRSPTPIENPLMALGITVADRSAGTTFYFRIRGSYGGSETSGGRTDWAEVTVTTALPCLTAFTPTSGVTGAIVTLHGQYLLGATMVRFNGVGVPVLPQNLTATSLTTAVPATATPGYLEIDTPGGTARSAEPFLAIQAPSIHRFDPKNGVVPGTTVRIEGRNLVAITRILLGSVAMSDLSAAADGNSVTATIPGTFPITVASAKLTVANPAGSATSADSLTLKFPPSIREVIPNTAAPGGTVVIKGVNFYSGRTAVRFNGVVATATVHSATVLSVKVPATATTGPITLSNPYDTFKTTADFVVNEACSPPPLKRNQSLFITAPAVVDNAARASWIPTNPNTGAWSLGRLFSEMAPEEVSADADSLSDWVRAFFRHWSDPALVVNGFPVPLRGPAGQPQIIEEILNGWPKLNNRTGPGAALDLSRAPFRLLAIVLRPDLAEGGSSDKAGEGRFLFALINPANNATLNFTLILEYDLSKKVRSQNEWDRMIYSLDKAGAFGKPYLEELESFTTLFSFRQKTALTDRPNRSALAQLRTNENILAPPGAPFQLREFALGSQGKLTQRAVGKTPDNRFNATALLADYLDGDRAAILENTHEVPLTFAGAPFAGAVSNIPFPPRPPPGQVPNFFRWTVPAAAAVEEPLRHKFSLNTCNGCHGGETAGTFPGVGGTAFRHVGDRIPGRESGLSPFTLKDIAVREEILKGRFNRNLCPL